MFVNYRQTQKEIFKQKYQKSIPKITNNTIKSQTKPLIIITLYLH